MSDTPTQSHFAPPQDLRRFESLVEIMRILRSPQGCPWDQEQTHESLARYAVEESYELMEAIEARAEHIQAEARGNPLQSSAGTDRIPGEAQGTGGHGPKASQMTNSTVGRSPATEEMIGELGDVLLQVIFHSELGRSSGEFTIEDVIQSINTKMVFRHPHVFAGAEVSSSAEVLSNWAKLKELEASRKQTRKKKSYFGLPPHLPALEQATKIGEKTHQAKFDWGDVPAVLIKMREEIEELEEAVTEGTIAQHEHEIGDVLFTVAQVARHLNLNAEAALRKTNRRFETRYTLMLELMAKENLNLDVATDDQKESFWQLAKSQLKETESHA